MLAIVLYTGQQTKINLNQGKYHYKRSLMEKKLNLILVFNVVLLFVLITIMSCTLLSKIEKQSKGKWYIYPEKDIDAGFYAATSVGSFFILLN